MESSIHARRVGVNVCSGFKELGSKPGSATYGHMRLLRASDSSLSPGNSNQPHFLRRREVTWVIAPPPSLQRARSEAPSLQFPRGPSRAGSQWVLLSHAAWAVTLCPFALARVLHEVTSYTHSRSGCFQDKPGPRHRGPARCLARAHLLP